MKFARIVGCAVGLGLFGTPFSAFAQHTHRRIPDFHLPKTPERSLNVFAQFPRVDIGLLSVCAGVFPGRGHTIFTGYCPSVRWRIKEKIGIAFEPAYAQLDHDRGRFGMFGLRPGVQYSLAEGRGITASSTAYIVGGMDLWIPTTSRHVAPLMLLGGHLGLGILLSVGHFGIGAEIRGLIHGGVGNQDAALAKELSAPRLGFEARVLGLVVSFW